MGFEDGSGQDQVVTDPRATVVVSPGLGVRAIGLKSSSSRSRRSSSRAAFGRAVPRWCHGHNCRQSRDRTAKTPNLSDPVLTVAVSRSWTPLVRVVCQYVLRL